MSELEQFPIFMTLKARKVVVIGGGELALRKLRLLQRSGARLVVIAPEIDGALRQEIPQAEYLLRPFRDSDLMDAAIVLSATGEDAVDRAVSKAARAVGVPVNAVDRPELSDFVMPAIIDRAPVVVAIGSGGSSPVLVRMIRERIERLLPAKLGALAEFAARFRKAVASAIPAGDARRRFWERVLDGEIASDVLSGRNRRAMEGMLRELNRHGTDKSGPGVVRIVGAGPGDPELLTLKAVRAMADVDVVLYDRLVDPRIMEFVRRDAERIDVGKAPGHHRMTQEGINALLAERALAGQRVLRLKGGDPFIFGRGGEEVDHLRALGIEVEVIPGITAAAAAAASAGVPLTHRGEASVLTFVSGRDRHDNLPDIDWKALAANRAGTIAVYMGVSGADDLAERLINAGLPPSMPVAIVENASRDNERCIATCIGGLGAAVAIEGVEGPALILIGPTAARASSRAQRGQNEFIEATSALSA